MGLGSTLKVSEKWLFSILPFYIKPFPWIIVCHCRLFCIIFSNNLSFYFVSILFSDSGATNPEYIVTADDVDKIIAVECIPMDDQGRQVFYVPDYK